ncbi:hypothetical protein TNCT_440291 [Trichonephila clavata]|uniref:Uncharacterized protein n=1 Tax=Trichonephila clavata TaxID=2740835 RepID=A0A8X6HFN3_TRICU|nr:hypothetical protein TNCT_440291 [Trichonephila clavata]
MASQTHLINLQVVQNIAFRLILNALHYIPRKYIHSDLKISPLHARIRELASTFFQNVPNHSNYTIAQAAFTTPGLHRYAAASASLPGHILITPTRGLPTSPLFSRPDQMLNLT